MNTVTQTENPIERLVGINARRLRKEQHLSHPVLAEKLTEYGHPINVQGLYRLERGERKVSPDDLVALAYVLGTTVVDLLAPVAGAAAVEVTPGHQLGAEEYTALLRRAIHVGPNTFGDDDPHYDDASSVIFQQAAAVAGQTAANTYLAHMLPAAVVAARSIRAPMVDAAALAKIAARLNVIPKLDLDLTGLNTGAFRNALLNYRAPEEATLRKLVELARAEASGDEEALAQVEEMAADLLSPAEVDDADATDLDDRGNFTK